MERWVKPVAPAQAGAYDEAHGCRLRPYRHMAAWLAVGEARVRRLWRELGLSIPRRRPKRRRSGSDIRLPGAVRPNAVWSYDFVHDQWLMGVA